MVEHAPPPLAQGDFTYKLATLNTQSKLYNTCELVINLIKKHDIDFCAIQDTGKIPPPYVFQTNNLHLISFAPPPMIKMGELWLL